MKYDQIMVDLETTGTDPYHNAIIQISAVRFNMDGEVDTNMFDECLHVPRNRYWCEDTREWWMQQNPKILNKIWGKMRDPATVLQEFRDWVGGDSPTLWAKPIHFEYPFLESYFRTFDVQNPFPHWQTQDLRSWCNARGVPGLDKELEFDGDAHDAIHDCLHQIKTLFTLLERTDVKTAE